MTLLAALIRKEFLLLLRDRQALALLFLLPVVFILIMSLAMQGSLRMGGSTVEDVLVADVSDSSASRALVRALGQAERFGITSLPASSAADAQARLRARIERGEARIGVFVPSGFEQALAQQAAPADAHVPVVYYAPALLPEVRRTFTLIAEAALERVRVSRVLDEAVGQYLPGGMPEVDGGSLRLRERVAHAGDREPTIPSAVQHSVPAWLVFSMFFVVAPIAASLIVERDQGTQRRLQQMGAPPLWLLGSRLVPYYLVNMVQLVLMLAVGVFLVPLAGGERLDLGSSYTGLWLIGSAVSLAAVGLALLIAAVSRTVVQATLSGGVFCLIIGALGGIMVPKAVMPPTMQQLTHVSPMSWGLEGFWDILLRYGRWQDVLPEASMLAAFGAVSWGLAALAAGRRRH